MRIRRAARATGTSWQERFERIRSWRLVYENPHQHDRLRRAFRPVR